MLAQNFMAAERLGIGDEEHAALVRVLGMLERGELVHVTRNDLYERRVLHERGFNMDFWDAAGARLCSEATCGTAMCIRGWAEAISVVKFPEPVEVPKLHDLFCPKCEGLGDYKGITPDQAAQALRNYLTTGEARWSEVLA